MKPLGLWLRIQLKVQGPITNEEEESEYWRFQQSLQETGTALTPCLR